jgi:hypothetical protein
MLTVSSRSTAWSNIISATHLPGGLDEGLYVACAVARMARSYIRLVARMARSYICLVARMARSYMFRSDVEAEVHDITFLDDVVLAFEA